MGVNVGIVGCGAISAFAHIPGLIRQKHLGVRITSLCDLDVARANRIQERFELNEARCVDDFDLLMRDSLVDAVIVAAWPTMHVPVALDAIAGGKHVLIQKPLGVNELECSKLLNAVRDSPLNILALPIVDSIPEFVGLKELIESGELGRVTFARIRTQIPGPLSQYADARAFFAEGLDEKAPISQDEYAEGAGALSDMGPYALTAFRTLFNDGDLLTAVVDSPRYESIATLSLRISASAHIEAGAICNIEVGWNQQAAVEICTVFGSVKSASILSDGSLSFYPAGDKSAARSRRTGLLPISPVAGQDAWISSILEGRSQAFIKSAEDANWSASIISRAYRMSSATLRLDGLG